MTQRPVTGRLQPWQMLPCRWWKCSSQYGRPSSSKKEPLSKPLRHSWGEDGEAGSASGRAHPAPPPAGRTHRAHEALGVPDALQRRQVIVRHRALAALAFWGKHGQEVLAAIRLPAPLVETCGDSVGMGTPRGPRWGQRRPARGCPGKTWGGVGQWDNLGNGCEGWHCGRTQAGAGPHTCPLDLPSSPNTFPQWAQKKWSGCQVWSRAVRTFCRKRCGEVAAVAGAGAGGRGLHLTDGAGAVGAERGEGSVIVLLTERPPAALEEGPAAQLLPAAGAREVLGVPGCAQGCENLRGQGSREPGHRQGGAGARPGLTLPATGLRQAAQTPAGAAEMPSSCRSWVRLPNILSSEGSGSAAPPAPCPAVASCGKEDSEDGVRTRTPCPRDGAHLALHVSQVGQELVQLPGGCPGRGRGERRLRGRPRAAERG